jgi:predicted RNase H-like nuclease (RuvC/YqgF family)
LTNKNQEIEGLRQRIKTNSESAGESFIKLRDYKNDIISHWEYKYNKLRYEYKETVADKERIIANLRNENFELQTSLIDSKNMVSLLLFQIDLQKFKHQLFLHSIFNDNGWGEKYDARNTTCKTIEKRLEYQRWIPKTYTLAWGKK